MEQTGMHLHAHSPRGHLTRLPLHGLQGFSLFALRVVQLLHNESQLPASSTCGTLQCQQDPTSDAPRAITCWTDLSSHIPRRSMPCSRAGWLCRVGMRSSSSCSRPLLGASGLGSNSRAKARTRQAKQRTTICSGMAAATVFPPL